MINKEVSQHPTILEKGLWWAEIGGVVAAFIGIINGWSYWIWKGGLVAGGSAYVRSQFEQARQNAASSAS